MNAEMSVVLAASGGYPTVRRTVRRLNNQSAAGRMELIVIGFGGPMEIPSEDVAAFASVQGKLLDEVVGVGTANAEGVRMARTAIVAFGEDHCFPEPGWGQALLDAHRSTHAVVAPVFRNANPATIVSWCDFLIGYGPWMEPAEGGLRPYLPGHNSSYKRDELLAYGDRLEEMLGAETVLHYDLVRRGRTLHLEPKAQVSHLNFSRFRHWLQVSFHSGRVFAGSRGADWTLPKRLFYAAASPLIPLVRLVRVIRELRAPGRPTGLLARCMPLLAMGLFADGVGQFAGYFAGAGMSNSALTKYEYNRDRFITETDRRELEAAHG